VSDQDLNPQSILIRPLSKGMATNLPTQMIPAGGGLLVRNFDVATIGLRTVSGWGPFVGLNSVNNYGRIALDADEYVTDIIPFQTSNARQLIALTTKRLFVSTDGVSWTEVVKVDLSTLHFAPGRPALVQWARSPYYLFFVDGTSATGLVVYDGVNVRREPCVDSSDVVVFEGATTIHFAGSRLIVGAPGESGGERRVRWSSPLNPFEFSPLDYADLIGTSGSVQRITSYEEFPIIFVDDGVYFGQPYGYDAIGAAAWIIRPLETGGNSILGPRAYCRVTGGVIFAGRDGFFFINSLKRTEKGDFTVDDMKCPILTQTIRNQAFAGFLANTMLVFDTAHKRLLIGFSSGAAPYGVDTYAALHQETTAWSLLDVPVGTVTALQDIYTTTSTRWADYPTSGDYTTWEDYLASPNRSWHGELGGFGASTMIAVNEDGGIYSLSKARGVTEVIRSTFDGTDYATLTTVFETGDIDFDYADNNKVAFKLAARIGDTEYQRDPTARIVMIVDGSTTRGRTWKQLGRVYIDGDEDEEEVHFRLFGTNMRFRITFFTDSPTFVPVVLEELTIRLRGGSPQTVRGATNAD